MTSAIISFTVEDDATLRMLREAQSGLEHIINDLATQAAHDLEAEGGSVVHSLAAPWEIVGFSGTERRVEAPVWWAHFLAGGTQAHGPVSADKLVFDVGGETVFATYVQGIPATHFDVAAIKRTETHVDEIVNRAMH